MKKILLIVCFGLLTSCVTPYQKNGFGGGYSEMALANDTYKVSFRGNGYSSQEHVQNYLLRRCAELTLQSGYKYFIVLGSNNQANQSTWTTPTTIQSNSVGTHNGIGNMYANNYGNSMYGNYSLSGNSYQNTCTTITPGQINLITNYNSTATIKMLKTNKSYPLAFDATIILSNFKENN